VFSESWPSKVWVFCDFRLIFLWRLFLSRFLAKSPIFFLVCLPSSGATLIPTTEPIAPPMMTPSITLFTFLPISFFFIGVGDEGRGLVSSNGFKCSPAVGFLVQSRTLFCLDLILRLLWSLFF
jgi:hypothetical protein